MDWCCAGDGGGAGGGFLLSNDRRSFMPFRCCGYECAWLTSGRCCRGNHFAAGRCQQHIRVGKIVQAPFGGTLLYLHGFAMMACG